MADLTYQDGLRRAAEIAAAYGAERKSQDNGEREGFWLELAANEIASAILAETAAQKAGGTDG